MDKIIFKYFHINQPRYTENKFLIIPKILIHNERFSKLSSWAIIAYGLFLDRTKLSIKNNWHDKEGRVYIVYTHNGIMKDLHCSSDTATKIKKELSTNGLIEVKRQGRGKPDLIYVKSIEMQSNIYDFGKAGSLKSEERISRNSKKRFPEIQKSDTNNTNTINTDSINTESSSTDDPCVLPSLDIEQVKRSTESVHKESYISEINKALYNILINGADIHTNNRLITNSDAKASYSKLTTKHIVDLINRIDPIYDSISNLGCYIEIALYREASRTPNNSKKSIHFSGERDYSKEYYDALIDEVTSKYNPI